MQNNNRKKNTEGAQDIPISQAATFEVMAGLFSTLSEGLATIATALAIQEAQQLAQQQTNINTTNNNDMQKIQQQLNYLTKEVKKISKALNI